MKNIEGRLLPLLKTGFCTPKVSSIARRLREPTTTIQYNIKRLEREGKVKGYKAVLNHEKLDRGFCAYALLELNPKAYVQPEVVARKIAKNPDVESVDICTGDWELIVKLRARDHNGYYGLVKTLLSQEEVAKIKSLISLKQMKSEFIEFKPEKEKE